MKQEVENMEERILKAAEELFLEQGFAGTTTGQIAKSAGCNQALVHYYYRTKENLFDKIFEEKARLLFANILNLGSSEILFEDKLKKMIGAHFDFLRQNPRLVPFVFIEIMSNPARLQSMIGKLKHYPDPIYTQMEDLLNVEREKGNISSISVADLLLTIISLNVAPFFILPVIQKATAIPDTAVDAILKGRKHEIVETILARLKK